MDGKTHIGDCLDLVKKLDDNSIDLIVTSPPYFNSSHKYQRGTGFHYTADVGEPLYVIEDFFDAVKPKLKMTGTVCLNLGFSYGETGVMRPYDILNRLRRNGYFVNDQIIWHKNNPIPLRNRLTNAYELIFVLSKTPETKYYTSEYTHNVWKFPVGNGKGNHSAVFPIELPKLCITHFSKENDLVLDPFMGSGTTSLACIELKRKWIGFELNSSYSSSSTGKNQ
jgi:site-specific DNA-methyltransferase (adenine-specific)